MEEIRYQGPSIVFQAKPSSQKNFFCISRALLINGETMFDCQEGFLRSPFSIYLDLGEKEQKSFAEWFYQIFPEYALSPLDFSPPFAIQDRLKFDGYTRLVTKVFQDKNGAWIVLVSQEKDIPYGVPSWDLALETVKKLKTAWDWETGWEI